MSDYILKFTAPWCGACQDLDEVIKDIDFGLEIKPIDVDKSDELLSFYGIKRIPTFIRLIDSAVSGEYLVTPDTAEEIQEWIKTSSK